MKTNIKTEVMTFDELSDSAKENARNWYLSCDLDCLDAWDNLKEDAKTVGLQIDSLDDHRANKGSFAKSAVLTAKAICQEHGEMCETYKTACTYLDNLEKIEQSNPDIDAGEIDNLPEVEALNEDFLQSLLEDYRIMFRKEEEYRTSAEYIDETILANEYTFTETGKRFG